MAITYEQIVSGFAQLYPTEFNHVLAALERDEARAELAALREAQNDTEPEEAEEES